MMKNSVKYVCSPNRAITVEKITFQKKWCSENKKIYIYVNKLSAEIIFFIFYSECKKNILPRSFINNASLNLTGLEWLEFLFFNRTLVWCGSMLLWAAYKTSPRLYGIHLKSNFAYQRHRPRAVFLWLFLNRNH